MATASVLQQSELRPDVIIDRIHRQLGADRDDGLIAACDEAFEDRVVTASVEDLWHNSRIKLYVPVLALRRARDEIQATVGLR